MRSDKDSDARLRAELTRLVAGQKATQGWPDVERRTHRLRRTRRAGRGVMLLALAAAVTLLGFWVYPHLHSGEPALVISDPSADPSVISPSSTSRTTTASAETQADFQGLWAGNVDTLPAHPESLPASFYQAPDEPAELVMSRPLWIFAEELTPEEVTQAVAAADEKQTILVFLPTDEFVEQTGIPAFMRPSAYGDLPAMFTQVPVLLRDKVFDEVEPMWQVFWADLGPEAREQSLLDPESAYAAGANITMTAERSHRLIEENKAQQAAGPYDPANDPDAEGIDPYPIQKQVESAKATELAEKAALYLRDLTGETFQVEEAYEWQMIWANDEVRVRFHQGTLTLAGPVKSRVSYSAYWSDEDQMGPGASGRRAPGMLGLGALFDAGEGARATIGALEGYHTRVQLADGLTVSADSGGPLGTAHGQAPAEASVLSPEEIIVFTRWLLTEAAYLVP